MEWILTPPSIVGRGSDTDISINHPSISRRHCQFHLNPEGALIVRDLNSTNGTYIDDKRVTSATLMNGDCIQLGAVTLRVELRSDTVVYDDPPKISDDMLETQRVDILTPDKLKDFNQTKKPK